MSPNPAARLLRPWISETFHGTVTTASSSFEKSSHFWNASRIYRRNWSSKENGNECTKHTRPCRKCGRIQAKGGNCRRVIERVKKLSLFNVQLSFVIFGCALRRSI